MEDISNNLGLPPWSNNPRPGPAPTPTPAPQTIWQAYQLAEQWCWDRWKELVDREWERPVLARCC